LVSNFAPTRAAVAPRVVAHAAQVPLRTEDFARYLRCLPSMRLKRFKS
jgi:hypothetical protein